jgi:hypothetical protein
MIYIDIIDFIASIRFAWFDDLDKSLLTWSFTQFDTAEMVLSLQTTISGL